MEACYELVAMPFESVIEQPSFRDKHGPLYLLRHMHSAAADPSLQVLFASVIRQSRVRIDHTNLFGEADNRREIEFAGRFLDNSDPIA